MPDKQLDPIPASGTRSSTPPSTPNVNGRVTSRQLTSGGRVHFVAEQANKPAPVEDDGQWYVPKE